MTVLGWCEDPWGRHEHRWYTDGAPTKLVRDQGVEAYDEPPEGDPPGPPVPVVEEAPVGTDDLARVEDRTGRSPGQAAFDVFDAIRPMP